MNKYKLIIILFIFNGNTIFAQTQSTKPKQMDTAVLRMIKENSKIVKAEKDRSFQNKTIADKNFDVYKTQFMNKYWRLNPEWATISGYHIFDTLLSIPNTENRELELSFYKDQLLKIQKISVDSLNELNKIDYKILKNEFNKSIWQITTLKSFEWNPANYNIGEAFSYVLSENYEPLNKRLNSFISRLRYVPAYFDAAKQNIKNPVPEYLTLAIEQNQATLEIFEKDFMDSLKTSGLTAAQQEVAVKRSKDAAEAIRSYVQFLKDFKNEKPRSFRLGSELYAQKFDYEIQSQYTIDEIYQAAIKRKEYLLNKMEEIADDYFVKKWEPSPNQKTNRN